MNGTRKEMLRNLSLTRERESLRNRCPSGQKAFIVLFRYGRRHKRGQPNSYGCRFCNIRVRPPIDRTDDHRHDTPSIHRNPMKLLRNMRPAHEFTSDSIPWNRGNQPPNSQEKRRRGREKDRNEGLWKHRNVRIGQIWMFGSVEARKFENQKVGKRATPASYLDI